MSILIAGFVLSLLGSLPPGLISLTVSYTAIGMGVLAATMVAAGAAFAEFFQAWLAVVLSDWFLSNPGVSAVFEWVAVVVFSVLAIFMLFFAQPPKKPGEIKMANWPVYFLRGVLISAFNLLAVPYWFTYCGWLRVEGIWQEGLTCTLVFSLGVSLGTMFAMGIYIWLSTLIVSRAHQVARYANRLIGLIFVFLALKTLINLLS
ncbi:MAG: LysE family transporter [Saprospiraceae bacterium]|nr:LysE family transporter [Saprospiraceae bacterium]